MTPCALAIWRSAWLSLACATLPGQSKAGTESPRQSQEAHVFVLAGQSNMEGVGRAQRLPEQKRTAANAFLFHSEALGKREQAGKWLPLQPAGWQGIADGSFGVEIPLGRALAEKSGGRAIYLIKHAVGGTSLARDWDPIDGPQYLALDALIREALRQLRERGLDPVIRGYFWQQGEADAKNADAAQAYERRLTNFIVRSRQRLAELDDSTHATKIRFVLGQVIPSAGPDTVAQRAYPFRKQVRHAQLAVPGQLCNVATVRTDAAFGTHASDQDGFRDKDNVHFNEPGLQMLGAGMANAYLQPKPQLQAVTDPIQPNRESLRVVTYNTYYVFGKGKRIKPGSQWLKQLKPDVVALQELTNIPQARLRELAASWNHEHTALLKEQGFSVGLTSKKPIQVVEKWVDGMHHGCLHARTADTHIFVVHLSPFRWRVRRAEAAQILKRIAPLLQQQLDVIVLGDFNAHSSVDLGLLQAHPDTLTKLRDSDKKHDHVENLRDGNYDFSVMKAFYDAGLTDAALPYLEQANELRWTIPSGYWGPNQDTPPEHGERIDYVLCNARLAMRANAAAVCRRGVVNQISDHYPVVVDFRRKTAR